MDPRTRTFLVFMGFSLVCLAAGYGARKRGLLSEHASRPLQLYGLLLGWGPVALVSFWRLPLGGEEGRQLLILLLSQPFLMLAAAAAIVPLCRWMRCTRTQTGVLIIGAGLSNTGFTLGSYLCYALLDPPGLAMSYGIALTMSMGVCITLFFYPIAWHYSKEEGSKLSRLIVESFIDVRAMPLYLSVLGVALNAAGVGLPRQVDDWRLMDGAIFFGSGAAYTGIGLRLRLGDSLGVWRMHLALAFTQFVFHPLLTLGLIRLLRAGGVEPGTLVRDVLVIESLVPTAVNVVILANLFHLNARLASVLWLWNTLGFCVFVLPWIVWRY